MENGGAGAGGRCWRAKVSAFSKSPLSPEVPCRPNMHTTMRLSKPCTCGMHYLRLVRISTTISGKWQLKDGFPLQLPETCSSLPKIVDAVVESVYLLYVEYTAHIRNLQAHSYIAMKAHGRLTSAPRPRARMTTPCIESCSRRSRRHCPGHRIYTRAHILGPYLPLEKGIK